MRRVRLGTDLSLAAPEQTVHLVRTLRPERSARWPGGDVLASCFELAPLEECDVAVLAMRCEETLTDERKRERAMAFCARAGQLDRSVFVFHRGDKPVRAPTRNTMLLAHALHASRRAPNEIALPCFVEDPLPSRDVDESEIEWRSLCLWVERADVRSIADRGNRRAQRHDTGGVSGSSDPMPARLDGEAHRVGLLRFDAPAADPRTLGRRRHGERRPGASAEMPRVIARRGRSLRRSGPTG